MAKQRITSDVVLVASSVNLRHPHAFMSAKMAQRLESIAENEVRNAFLDRQRMKENARRNAVLRKYPNSRVLMALS